MWGFIHKWHRKVGITAAFFVMLLVVSGLLLNHTDKLNLQNIYVKNDTLLKWYHIQPKGQIKSFRVEKHWFTQIGSHLYFDQKELAVHIENLFGAVRISDGFVIALDESLLILTLSGEIVEGISGTDGVPAGVILLACRRVEISSSVQRMVAISPILIPRNGRNIKEVLLSGLTPGKFQRIYTNSYFYYIAEKDSRWKG